MKVREMLERLAGEDPDTELMCLDGPNGLGIPRELNLGPTAYTVTADDADECADCEGFAGERVLVVGYGCY